jgi:SAM-dependent methyltransferase
MASQIPGADRFNVIDAPHSAGVAAGPGSASFQSWAWKAISVGDDGSLLPGKWLLATCDTSLAEQLGLALGLASPSITTPLGQEMVLGDEVAWSPVAAALVGAAARNDAITDLVLDLRAPWKRVAAGLTSLPMAVNGLREAFGLFTATHGAALSIHMLVEGVYGALDSESSKPAAAALVEMAITQNMPHVACIRVVDLAGGESPDPVVLARVLRMPSHDSRLPAIHALRGKQAWSRQCQVLPVASHKDTPRRGQTFLVAGGNQPSDYELAGRLRREWDANVVVLGNAADNAGSTVGGENSRVREAVQVLPSILARVEAAHPATSLSSFGSLERELQWLCAALTWREFNRALAEPLTQIRSRAMLERQLLASPAHKHLFGLLLSILETEGWLRMEADALHWKSAADVEALCAQISAEELAGRYPEFSGLIELTRHCTEHMVPVMQAKQEPLPVLFPDGTGSFMAEKSRRTLDYSNLDQLRLALLEFVGRIADSCDGRPLRILEVGGGTGMLTKPLAESLKGKNVEYVFTDIGRGFLLDAERHAREHGIGFMSCRRFDASRDPAEQGFELGTYDLVLALDVIHVTPDIKQSASHIRSLLAPGGALCVIELVTEHAWTHLAFGLLPGWWSFVDAPLRATSPLLDATRWESVLRSARFEEVVVLPGGKPEGARAEKILAIAIKSGEQVPDDGIVVMETDVGDARRVRETVEAIRSQFGALDGVFHTAASQGHRHSAGQGDDAFERWMHVQHGGLGVLVEALRHSPPRFIARVPLQTAVPLDQGQLIASALLDAEIDRIAASYPCQIVSIHWDRPDGRASPVTKNAGSGVSAELNMVADVIASGHRGRVLVQNRI